MKLSRTSFFTRLSALIISIKEWLFVSLRIQIVLFLVTLPILSAWGLPFSLASILGNLLFAPWATVFLGLSTLWFISHLCGLPNLLIVYCLESLVSWWLWCLSWGSSRMLFAVPMAHPFFLICIPLSAFMVLYSNLRSWRGIKGEVVALSVLALAWCLVLTTWAPSSIPIALPHGGGTLWLCPQKHGVALVDSNGVLRKLPASSSWINFSLSTVLARHFGTCQCNDIVIMKPTIPRLYAAATLIRSGKAKRLVIPDWIISKKWWLKWRESNKELLVKSVDEKAIIRAYAHLEGNPNNVGFDST